MASVVDLSWTNTAELFRDVDLDALYLRQLESMGGNPDSGYPYHILVFTGKITIGINLGNRLEAHGPASLFRKDGCLAQDDPLSPWSVLTDPSD
jgi:hypothetical protein